MRPSSLLRQLAAPTARSFPPPHTLVDRSPFIRPLPAGPSRAATASLESDFQLYPAIFDLGECRQLLKMALWKLDRVDSTRKRRRRGMTLSGTDKPSGQSVESVQELFEGEYGFEEGHYDSVIHNYRETLLSNFPPQDAGWPDLLVLMKRIYQLLPVSPAKHALPGTINESDEGPPRGTSTHLLHLAPQGAILPHVDNLEASGSVIIGTSLGAERILRLKEKGSDAGWDVRLPNGSVYLQRDAIRYRYEHSILPYDDPGSVWDSEKLRSGHRISLMVRDAYAKTSEL